MFISGKQRNSVVSADSRFLVIQDAVIGGGFDLRAGQVVESTDLGNYVQILVTSGAVVAITEDSAYMA